MAILTPTDLATLAPELDIDPGAINSVILTAQMIAEGPDGANRPLEKHIYTETPLLNSNGIVKLSRLPITDDTTPIVEIRGKRLLASFGLPVNDTEWITLVENSDYMFDAALGEVKLNRANLSGVTSSSWARYGRHYGRPTQRREATELKVTYTTGFDFQANPLSYEAQQIKIAVIGVAKLQQSPMASGIKQYSVTGFYSVALASETAGITATSGDRTLMQDLLMVLRKYRPREFTQ